MTGWQVAQYNVAQARTSADSPEMAEFYQLIPQVNAVAEASPGFVWRLKEDPSSAASNTFLLVNLSVWESVEALRDFAYRSSHLGAFRDRGKWFHRAEQAGVVMWWVPAGHRPSIEEGAARLDLLRANGASIEAFDFAHAFSAPGA